MKTSYPMLKMMLLSFLSKQKEATGYDFLKYAKEKGMPASAGTVYPQLNDLLSKKMVKLKIVGRKKIYSLTSEGNDFMKQLRENTETIKLMLRKIGIIVRDKNPSMPEDIRIAVKKLLYVLHDLSTHDFNVNRNLKESLNLIEEVEKILRRIQNG